MPLINIPINGIGSDGYIGDKTKGVVVPVYDESKETVVNFVTHLRRKSGWEYFGAAWYSRSQIASGRVDITQNNNLKLPLNWNLLYVIKSVFETIGYTVDLSEYDKPPYNKMFIANPSTTVVAALPHWTLKEFVEQLELFLNARIAFNDDSKSITFLEDKGNNQTAAFENADEFSIEYTEESESSNNIFPNIEYSQSDSFYRTADMVDEETIMSLQKKNFNSFQALQSAYNSASEYDKANYLWICPEGTFTKWVIDSWDYDGSGNKTERGIAFMRRINEFGADIRDARDNVSELKICPASMAEDIGIPIYFEISAGGNSSIHPFPGWGEEPVLTFAKLPVIDSANGDDSYFGEDGFSIQGILQGDESAEDNSAVDKADRLDIIFVDGQLNEMTMAPCSNQSTPPWGSMPVPMGYVSYRTHNIPNIQHSSFTMAIKDRPSNGSSLWRNRYHKVDYKKKYTIKFIANEMPDAKKIFVFNNKKFVCAKVETNIAYGKLEKLMTGEFYMIE